MIYFSRSKEELEQKNGTLLYKYTYSDIETFPFEAISKYTNIFEFVTNSYFPLSLIESYNTL